MMKAHPVARMLPAFLLTFFLSGCGTQIFAIQIARSLPLVNDITAPSVVAGGAQSLTVDLPYTDPAGGQASDCSIPTVNKVAITQPCACTTGDCTVGVAGAAGGVDSGSFTYTVTVNGKTSAPATATIPLTCPSGYVSVPENTELGVSGFCVMKYEAKDDGFGNAVSTTAPLPWTSITPLAAKTACGAIGAQYDLISNAEWMAIARNAEAVVTNWSGGVVGAGVLPIGHADNNPAGRLPVADPTDSYTGTGNNSGQADWSGKEQRRTITLSNGSVIWDLAGNAYEFVDWTLGGAYDGVAPASKAYLGADGAPVFGFRQFSALNMLVGLTDVLSPNTWRASDASYTHLKGIGGYYAGLNNQGGSPARGGYYNLASGAGIYTLSLSATPATVNALYGYRCVFRP